MKFQDSALGVLAFLALTGIAQAKDPAAQATSQSPIGQSPPGQNPSAQSPTSQSPISWVRTKEGGAKLRNLPDAKGEIVLDAPSGALLAVFANRAGWLEVEPASGMKVWIYGSYLKPSGAPGVVEVTANNVRMRPLPSSDEKSFPLPMKLDRGERVHVIARSDPNKALGEDWVQVWSPAGARAYVAESSTAPVAAGEDARAAWTAAVKAAQAAMPVIDIGESAVASSPPVSKGGAHSGAASEAAAKKAEPKPHPAVDKLADAEKLMAAARSSENPDFTAAKAAYQAVVTQSPEGASADSARSRIQEIEIREEMQRLKLDKETYEKQRVAKLSESEAKLRDVARRQDPLWGRFQARGWLERELKPGQLPRYVVKWSGNEVAEIACGSGRYELDTFVGYEIGVLGVTQRAAVPGTADLPGSPARIDATRIEVISARAGR